MAGVEPNQKRMQNNRRPFRAGKGLVFSCLLVAVAGGMSLGTILRQRFASHQLLAYQLALAEHDPALMAARRTVYAEKKLPSRTTFSEFLNEEGIDADTASGIVRDARPVYDLSRVRAGNSVKIARSGSGELRGVIYQIDRDHVVWVTRGEEGFSARIEDVPFVVTSVGVSGQVRDSLIQAVEDAGEHDPLALALADIFGWDLDFNTDTRRGDAFKAIVEKKTLHGEFQGYGKVLSAEYHNGGHIYQAVLFHDPQGRPAYYAPSGQSMKKAFLRSPLQFAAHVTSRFTYSRFHPILKHSRPHLGIDYAAPVGSAVQAVADGTVVQAGWNGDSGKEVRVRHALGYETYYLHLSQILVRPGQRVQQGEIVARTGATGLATGPHLDFRITQHGRFRNFLALNLPPAEGVAKNNWDEFEETRARLLDEMASLRTFQTDTTQRADLQALEPSPGKGM